MNPIKDKQKKKRVVAMEVTSVVGTHLTTESREQSGQLQSPK
jgi:hypothetical protein